MKDFLQLAAERFSLRQYDSRPVEEEKIAALIEAVRLAPTAVNRQPFHVWVIASPEAREKIKGCTKFDFGSPLVFVIGCKAEEAWERPYDAHNHAEIDASIAGTHLMLCAQDLGLGTCWVGHFDPEKVLAAFPEMAGYTPVALFPCGYAAADGVPSPRHEQRKSPAEIATRL